MPKVALHYQSMGVGFGYAEGWVAVQRGPIFLYRLDLGWQRDTSLNAFTTWDPIDFPNDGFPRTLNRRKVTLTVASNGLGIAYYTGSVYLALLNESNQKIYDQQQDGAFWGNQANTVTIHRTRLFFVPASQRISVGGSPRMRAGDYARALMRGESWFFFAR